VTKGNLLVRFKCGRGCGRDLAGLHETDGERLNLIGRREGEILFRIPDPTPDVYAQLLDLQIVNGSGSGELQGLLGVTGITAVTYVDATPTVAEFWPKLLETISSTSTAWKNPAGTVVLHLRRLAWMHSVLATPPVPPPGVRFVASGSSPATLGAGTEDAAIVGDLRAVKLYTACPQFRVSFDTSGSGTGTVQVWAYGYAALGSSRQPAALGKLTGTGLAAPTFA